MECLRDRLRRPLEAGHADRQPTYLFHQSEVKADPLLTDLAPPKSTESDNRLKRFARVRGLQQPQPEVGLRLAWTLLFFWQMDSSVNEGIRWGERLLAVPGAEAPTPARAYALLSVAYLMLLRGDFDIPWLWCQEALSRGRALGDRVLEWNALHFCAVNGLFRGDLTIAEEYLQHAVACAHAASLATCEATSLGCLGMIACDQADYDTARPLVSGRIACAETIRGSMAGHSPTSVGPRSGRGSSSTPGPPWSPASP
jgi:hypothetical protein